MSGWENDPEGKKRAMEAARQARLEKVQKALSNDKDRTDKQIAKNATKWKRRAAKSGEDNADFGKAKPKEKASTPQGDLYEVWQRECRKAFPDIQFGRWDKKEFVLATGLIDIYGYEITEAMIHFVVRNWVKLKTVWWKDKGSHAAPSIGLIRAMHSSVAPSAQKWVTAVRDIAEGDRYLDENPDTFDLPGDLSDRVYAARTVLKELGVADGT